MTKQNLGWCLATALCVAVILNAEATHGVFGEGVKESLMAFWGMPVDRSIALTIPDGVTECSITLTMTNGAKWLLPCDERIDWK